MIAGEEIGGYRLLRRLGTGGAGTVWLAEDGGGMRVALKTLHPALAASEEARTRLVREARTVNAVRTGGVAHVLDVEADALQPFVVSEYIPGPTLAEVIRRTPLEVREIVALAESLASTLRAVHDAGVVHRDVKPSNVILSPTGPVLIDFGIARGSEDDPLTSTGLLQGTAGYTAPALLRGEAPSPASDWWAWAATLLSAATGRPPFGAGSPETVLARVLSGRADTADLPPAVAHAFTSRLAAPGETGDEGPDTLLGLLTDPRSWRWPRVAQDATVPLRAPHLPEESDAGATRPLAFPSEVDEEATRALDRAEAGETENDMTLPLERSIEEEYAATRLLERAETAAPPHWAVDAREGEEGNPAPFPPTDQWLPPAPPPLPSAPVLTVLLVTLLASLTVLSGPLLLVVDLAALLLLALIGAGPRFLRQRRERAGGSRSTDVPAALLASPWLLLRSLLEVGVGAVVALLAGAAVHLAGSELLPRGIPAIPEAVDPTGPGARIGALVDTVGDVLTGGAAPGTQWPNDLVATTGDLLLLWLALVVALALVVLLPTGLGVRVGAGVLAAGVLPTRRGRLVLGVILAALAALTLALALLGVH